MNIDEAAEAVAQAAAEVEKTTQQRLRAVPPQEVTTAEKVMRLEKAQTQIRDEVTNGLRKLTQSYRERAMHIKNDYETRIEQEIARLKSLAESEMRELGESYRQEKHDLEGLLRRLDLTIDES